MDRKTAVLLRNYADTVGITHKQIKRLYNKLDARQKYISKQQMEKHLANVFAALKGAKPPSPVVTSEALPPQLSVSVPVPEADLDR